MEVCPEHSGLMSMVGQIDERTKSMEAKQDQLFSKVNNLIMNGEVQKAVNGVKAEESKSKKDFWGKITKGMLTTLGGVITIWLILMIIEHASLVLKAIKAG